MHEATNAAESYLDHHFYLKKDFDSHLDLESGKVPVVCILGRRHGTFRQKE